MTEIRDRMIEDMQLREYAEKTQQAYLTAVRGLAKYYRRPPDELGAEEIRQFFLYLVNDKAVASGTLNIYLCGIKFFYERTLEREWTIFDLVGPRKERSCLLFSVSMKCGFSSRWLYNPHSAWC